MEIDVTPRNAAIFSLILVLCATGGYALGRLIGSL